MYQFPMYFPQGFDVARARELAQLCQESYRLFELTPPPAKYEVAGYDDVTPLRGGCRLHNVAELLVIIAASLRLRRKVCLNEMFGFVARRGDDVYVVFRGTDSVLDFVGDLHMSQVPLAEVAGATSGSSHWPGARLEQGVWETYTSMREQLLDVIASHDRPGRRLFVTGHSLGAGLAVAAIPDLLLKTGFEYRALYTFAGPRVANREFCLALLDHGLPCYRVVHVEDVVPTLPPATPVTLLRRLMHGRWFYSHVGTPVNFGRAWAPTENPDIKANHAITLYIDALDQAVS